MIKLLLVLLTLNVSLMARLGETTKEVLNRYGKVIKKEKINGITVFQFNYKEMIVTVYLDTKDNKTLQITYKYDKSQQK